MTECKGAINVVLITLIVTLVTAIILLKLLVFR
jgi:hypothetical protein